MTSVESERFLICLTFDPWGGLGRVGGTRLKRHSLCVCVSIRCLYLCLYLFNVVVCVLLCVPVCVYACVYVVRAYARYTTLPSLPPTPLTRRVLKGVRRLVPGGCREGTRGP